MCAWKGVQRVSTRRQGLGSGPPADDHRRLEGRAGICEVAEGEDGQGVSVVERSGMGIRGARGKQHSVPLGRRHRAEPGELSWLRQSVEGAYSAGGKLSGERIRFARRARKRVGVGGRLLERQLRGSAKGWEGVGEWRLQPAGASRRFLVRRTEGHAVREPLLVHRRIPEHQQRLPRRPDAHFVPSRQTRPGTSATRPIHHEPERFMTAVKPSFIVLHPGRIRPSTSLRYAQDERGSSFRASSNPGPLRNWFPSETPLSAAPTRRPRPRSCPTGAGP